MKSTEIAALANQSAQMIHGNKTINDVTEYVRNRVSHSLKDEPLTAEDIERQVRHVLNVAFKTVARDYAVS